MYKDIFPEEVIETLDMVLNAFDGALVVDAAGRIVVYTDNYARVAQKPKADVLGRNIKDVWPDSRMLEVITSGKPIYIDLWDAGTETVFVSRYPITCEGSLVGVVAVCIFRYMDEARRFAEYVRKMGQELEYYKTQLTQICSARYSIDSIIGNSSAIETVRQWALALGKLRSPVLICGETGTGKELFAHAIHQASSRRDRPFVRVNCASIPENLVESELFGYDEGAFSGARKGGKPGKFELANGGTIFLDEINELPYQMQAKMLRVLQEGELDRVGSTGLTYIDVRIICATNTQLAQLIKEKRFRQDLYYRINAFQLTVPALRERLEDLPLLSEHFLTMFAREMNVAGFSIDDSVLKCFASYRWPGNIRELRNVLQRACIIAGAGRIKMCHLPGEMTSDFEEEDSLETDELQHYMQEVEKKHIVKVLQSVRWNRNQAAELLNIDRTLLYRKMKKYDLLNK